MPDYGEPQYWDDRYAKNPPPFDWLQTYETLKTVIEGHITPTDKILIVGCGNACFSEDLYDAGYHNIDNIDISSVVIQQMQERNVSRPSMTFTVMDVTQMDFPDNTYDAIIDKSTMDALFCATESNTLVHKMTKELFRVLRVGGRYINVSLYKRIKVLRHVARKCFPWAVTSSRLPNPRYIDSSSPNNPSSYHSLVVCTKLEHRLIGTGSSFEPDSKEGETESALLGAQWEHYTPSLAELREDVPDLSDSDTECGPVSSSGATGSSGAGDSRSEGGESDMVTHCGERQNELDLDEFPELQSSHQRYYDDSDDEPSSDARSSSSQHRSNSIGSDKTDEDAPAPRNQQH